MNKSQLAYNAEFYPIRCIDCGVIISQYEHHIDNCIESWGYRDTVERAMSFDSLRCGKCCMRILEKSNEDLGQG